MPKSGILNFSHKAVSSIYSLRKKMSNQKIEEYISLLEADSRQDQESVANFKKFVNADDPSGLFSLGKTITELQIKIEVRDNIIWNIKQRIKNL